MSFQSLTPYYSTTQAGFCKQKDTIHQLQNIIMALEDAKLFKQDVYALIVDFTSAFNTTDHDRMFWIMYDLGFPIEAVDTVKNLYEEAKTQVRIPSGGHTEVGSQTSLRHAQQWGICRRPDVYHPHTKEPRKSRK
jgi:hypothetical protein